MAGIGFELKKLFSKKGVLNSVKAYGFAAVICTGPMLLGILLLFGITALCTHAGADLHTRELLVCMITYTLLASVSVTALFSMVVTRYVSDMMFDEKNDTIIPAFWGSTVLMMILGSILFGTFLIFSGTSILQEILCFTLFNELIIVWSSMSFLSAIKDYKGIFLSFLISIAVSFIVGVLLLMLDLPIIESLLFAVMIGYGVMLIWNVILLHRYFPHTHQNAFVFLEWLDEFWPLALSGFLMNIGMFAHLVIMWFSDIGKCTNGLYFSAPWYDVPALLAYMTTFITTINFVVSVEVNFYPKYRTHYNLYNDRGTIDNIQQAEKEMMQTLKAELLYTSLKQLLFTVVVISLGSYLLDLLPLGFNEIMRGYFRTLCAAYGVYAIGNMLLLILFYFTDYIGALISTAIFAFSVILFTIVSLSYSNFYYGFGFLIAAVIFAIVTIIRLDYFTKHLPYYILSTQPLVSLEHTGIFTNLGKFLKKHLEEKDE